MGNPGFSVYWSDPHSRSRNCVSQGAELPTFETLKNARGLKDLWQLHYAVDAGSHPTPEQFIANLGVEGTKDTGVPDEATVNYLKVMARSVL